jgi:xanthine/CO dehydrogenase XdhC/CoxF family maturation factor
MTLLETAAKWRSHGHGAAIATVISTWGSAPRPAGSILVICDDGMFEGSVSGGCVEAAVISEAADVIRTGVPKRLSFGIANETAWAAGLACGGQIEIFVEAIG